MRVTECLANAERTPTEYELEVPMRNMSIGLARIRATDLAGLRERYDRWQREKGRQEITPATRTRGHGGNAWLVPWSETPTADIYTPNPQPRRHTPL